MDFIEQKHVTIFYGKVSETFFLSIGLKNILWWLLFRNFVIYISVTYLKNIMFFTSKHVPDVHHFVKLLVDVKL